MPHAWRRLRMRLCSSQLGTAHKLSSDCRPYTAACPYGVLVAIVGSDCLRSFLHVRRNDLGVWASVRMGLCVGM
jgi:hypothetical protein